MAYKHKCKHKTFKLLEDDIKNLGDLGFGCKSSDATSKKHSPWKKKLVSWTTLKLKTVL